MEKGCGDVEGYETNELSSEREIQWNFNGKHR